MRARQLFVLGAVSLMLLASAAQAVIDDFESYPLNSVIAGQGGWVGWGGPAAAQELVSNIQARSGEQSLQLAGGDADVVHMYAGMDSGIVEMTAWQYIPSSEVEGTTYYILMNTFVNPAGPFSWSSEIHFDLGPGTVRDVLHQTAAVDGGVDNTLSIIRDQWVEIKHVIDMDNDWYTVTYGGALLTADEWDNNGVAALAALDLFAPDANTVYYDDVLVPEPATMSLLVLGGLAVLRRKRR